MSLAKLFAGCVAIAVVTQIVGYWIGMPWLAGLVAGYTTVLWIEHRAEIDLAEEFRDED